LQLLVKTPGKQPLLLEQPVYITVEEKQKEKEKDTTTEVAAATH
jgi:hypothetical protein